MGLRLEWDKKKAIGKKKKHGIDFEEATTVFGDSLSLTKNDPLNSHAEEERYVTIGLSYRQKLLVIVHCDREQKIRVISARRATKRERKAYKRNR
ncbi:MAG: BrnT family toxin [Spirochaetales bacterium]|nr:BrnT family toxin [Spirochaetales bacterium]